MSGWQVGAPLPDGRPLFDAADWLWRPIPASPVLDANSAAMVTSLADGQHVANLHQYGVTMVHPNELIAGTPRYTVTLDSHPTWGPNPLGSDTVPIPAGMLIPPGGDGHVTIADPIAGKVYSMWQMRFTGSAYQAGWAGVCPLGGDGIEYLGMSTATRLSRYGAVIRASEIAAGVIPHALFFSTNMPAPEFRYPAQKSDGENPSGAPVPIPEGARVQLDPSVNLASISGITPAELAVGTALQNYGAYAGDNGGARMAFLFEYQAADPGAVYTSAGLAWDYWDMVHIPWDQLRVLKRWDGAA